ncbi:hypothetical protein [Duganella sacchari]|uniref:hypothetical protein n=1 Tax=Duganella sacchari TaxID=551987 RepID=UPI00093393B9|nr:hypothetical protein [Duganella sacchari]
MSRVTGSSPALALVRIIPFDLVFLRGQLLWVARIARADELALWPDVGFYVLVVTLLTSMKLIIALLVQEVKRYVVISLILFRNYLILKVKIAMHTCFSWCFMVLKHHSIMPLKDVLTHSCGMR